MNWCKIYCSWLDIFRFHKMPMKMWGPWNFRRPKYLFCVSPVFVWFSQSPKILKWSHTYFIRPIVLMICCISCFCFFSDCDDRLYTFAWGYCSEAAHIIDRIFDWLVSENKLCFTYYRALKKSTNSNSVLFCTYWNNDIPLIKVGSEFFAIPIAWKQTQN